VKAAVNQRLNTKAGPEQPTPRMQPLISTGSESVVKAEIDASCNVSAAGDIVGHKEVHTTHQETHVHQAESGATAFARFFSENCTSLLEKRLQQECQEAKSSDAMLFAFITKQISTIESSGAADWIWKNPCHYSAGMYALEIIEQRNGGIPELLDRVARMRDKLSGLRSSAQSKSLGCGTSLLGIVLLLFALGYCS